MATLEKLLHAIELQRHLAATDLLHRAHKERYSVERTKDRLSEYKFFAAKMVEQLYPILTKMWGDDWDVVHNNYIVHLYNQVEITTTTHLKHTSHEVFFALPIDTLLLDAVEPTFAKTLFTLDEVSNWYIHSHVSVMAGPVSFRASACFGNIFMRSNLTTYARIEALIAILPQYLAIESVGTVPYHRIDSLGRNKAWFDFRSLSRPTEPLTVCYSINANGVIEASVQDDEVLDRWLGSDKYVAMLYQDGNSLYYKNSNSRYLPRIPRNWHVPYLGKLYKVRILGVHQNTNIPPLVKQLVINELNERITTSLATKQRQEVYLGADEKSIHADTDSVLISLG